MQKKKIFFAFIASAMTIFSCSKNDTTSTPPAVPVANFSWQSANLQAPSTVTFSNTSTNATSYSWDFGDGQSSTATNPSHVYSLGGTYNAVLTATGAGGSATSSATITISNQVQPTQLQIKVLDANTNIVQGATVTLYGSYNDYLNSTNSIGTAQTTNNLGIVTFTSLQPQIYYWDAFYGCQNNINTTTHTASAIAANTTNTVITSVNGTGTLTFISNSTNPYKVDVNGVTLINSMAGGTTQNLYYKPTGSYSITVTQLSGYVVSPTIKTYSGNLSCGGTLTTTFPN